MEPNTFDIDFELPDVAGTTEVAHPKIHIAGDLCVSCEG
jgi:hypothetical protein